MRTIISTCPYFALHHRTKLGHACSVVFFFFFAVFVCVFFFRRFMEILERDIHMSDAFFVN